MTDDSPTPGQAKPPGKGKRGPGSPPWGGRDNKGKYTRSIDTALRDAQAARLRSQRKSYRQIAEEMDYADHTSARDAVLRALAAAPREAGEEMRQHELNHLDELTELTLKIAKRKHLAYNNKGVVEWDGEALEDDAPGLAAARVLKDLSESRRRLLGLDAETKVNVSGDVRYEVVGLSSEDITGSGGGGDADPSGE